MGSFDDLIPGGSSQGGSGAFDDLIPKKSSLARRVLGDTGVSLLKGAVAVPEAAVGLADIVSGGLAGKYAEQAGFRPKEAKAALDEMYSPEQKAANQYVQEGDGFVDTFKRAIDRPSVIGQSVAESLPLLLPGAAAARGIGAATKVAPYIAGAAGEGLVGAGSAAEQLRQGSEDGTLSGKQTIGALASGVGTAGFGALGGKVASSAIGKKLGISDIDTVLAGGASNPANVGLAKRALSGAVSEGVLEELPQSMWEQAAQNYATDKPLGEGVGQAGAMGLLAGTAMGGTFNAMQRGEQRRAVDDTKPAVEETPPAALGLTYQPGPAMTRAEYEQDRANKEQGRLDSMIQPADPEPKLPENGPMAAALNVGIDSGATSLRPQGSFSDTSEFANLLGEEQQDVQSRRTGIAGRQALQREVALQDADQRVADQMAKEAAQRRRAVLDQVLSDPTTQNPADRFAAELQRQGFRDSTPTADELATVQRFNDIKAAEPAGPEIEPSLPNEVDAEQLGIRSRKGSSGAQSSGRDKVAEVRQLVADGWKISNRTLVSPTGKKRILNTAEHAAAKEATRERNLAAMERYRQSKGKGTPVSTTNAASEETNAPEIEQLASQAPQANDAQVEPQPSAAPQAEGVTQPELAEAAPAVAQSDVEDYGKRVVRRKKGNEARDDLVGAIMRVTGGNGVAASMSQTITGDTANRASKVRGLFTNNGTMDLDDIANDLRTEEGYDVKDGNHLSELIREQAAGNPVYSMERNERDAAANEEKKQKDAVLKQANELGLKGVGGKRTLAVVEAEIAKVEAERNELEKRQERAAIQAEAIAEKLDSDGLDLTEADLMSWLGSIVEYTQDDINEANSRASEIASRRAETNAIVDSEGQAQSSGGERAKDGSTQEGARSNQGFDLTKQTNEQAAEQFAQQNAPESDQVSKEQADRERDAVPFSMQQESQPKPQGRQTGLFTADGRVSSESKQSKQDQISDFGEKLGGAKKDRIPSLEKTLSDEDIATLPLSKIWPASEIDGVENKFAAAVSYAARNEIPAKPRVSYKVASWVEKVKMLRGLASKIVGIGEGNARDLFDKVMQSSDFKSKIRLMEAIDRSQWSRIGKVGEHPNAYRYGAGGEKIISPSVIVEIDGKTQRFEGAKSIPDAMDRINAALSGDAEAKKMQFEVRGRTGAFSINKKGDKEYRKLKTFSTTKEAFDFIKSNYDDLVSAWGSVKETDNVTKTDVRNSENRPRTGKDRRNGKDVTDKQFQDAFGFRGVEFGNWVQQGANAKERQGMLNQAFDAMHDLAEIVGIPPKAISLNGTLGLGFGSRGSGSASAHFEPGNLVINLTKTRRAGTLAHEWFHALDNYFARSRNNGNQKTMAEVGNSQDEYRRQNFITYKPERLYVHKTQRSTPTSRADLERLRAANPNSGYFKEENWQADPRHPEGVRIEVESAFSDLVNALNESPMARRAKMIDKGPNGYWSRIIERGARSFENYVISKMMEGGYNNDYLANVREVQDFPRSKERYPYLLPEEVAPISEAFDALFSTIQTKETDKGVAMFSRDDVNASRGQGSGMAFRDLQAVVDRVSKGFNNLPKIHVLDSPKDLSDRRDNERTLKEQIEQAGAMDDVEGAHHNGEIYLFASGIASEERAEHVLATHEITHYGLRGTMGKGLDSALQNIWLYNKEVRAKAAVLRMQLGLTSNVSAVEEVLAEMKDSDLVKLKGWRKMVQAFRDWAHKAGFDRIAEKLDGLITKGMSEQEKADLFVANMVNAARDWVRNGKPARGYDPGTSMLGDANFSAKNDTINVDGVDRPTTNSNGKPIAQTKEGLRNFWRWFGDSRVVDSDGRPRVVYHGTTANIEAFDLSRSGEFGERFADAAFFTSNPEIAAGYAQRLDSEHNRLMSIEDELRSAYGKAVVKQFAETKTTSGNLTEEIKRQYDAAVVARQSRRKALFTNKLPTSGANIVPVYLRANNPVETDALGGFFFKTHKQAFAKAEQTSADSVIVSNVIDRSNEFADGTGDVFAVFSPSQIKSAIGNNGDFDALNPDIRFSRNKSASVDASIAEIFNGLAGRGLKKVRAEERLAEHPQAESIRYVQDNILDILEELEGAGTIKINC